PELSKAVEQAKALRLLYIPDMNKWPKERRDAFWSSLTVWISAHVKNYDDYASEFLETPINPIRQVEEEGKGFGDRKWQIRVGILDGGHVVERWQDSEDLTRIMNAMVKRIVETTQKELAARWEKKAPAVGPSETGGVYAADRPSPAWATAEPTERVSFKDGIEKIYRFVDNEVE